MTIGEIFEKTVAYYDDWMKVALPGYDDIYATALDLIPFDEDSVVQVLDLGTGTGLFSQHVFDKYPRAEFVLCDLAPKMLEVAKNRFQAHEEQFEYVLLDYRDFQISKEYDLVISSFSIHHLVDGEKQQLFQQVYQTLKSGGVFINADQIKGPAPYMQNLYWETWLKNIRARGAKEDQIQESIIRRTKYDQDASLTDQLQWLSDAGFEIVDCVYKNFFIGVFFGAK